MPTSPTEAPTATHPLGAGGRRFSWFIQGLGIVGAGALLAPPVVTPPLWDSPATVIVLAVGAVLVLALTTRIGIDIRRSALVLTAEGLDYQGVGYRVRAAWSAVRYLGSGSPRLLVEAGSFELQGWFKGLWAVGVVTAHGAQAQAKARLVHLKYYDDAWPNGRLAADLRRLAPGLLPPSP